MISELLANPEWDSPFFKVLANNDTGAAAGHQGGAVIPKLLQQYFPSLTGITNAANPTIDYRIFADLYAENKFLGTVSTRYQFQTWRGTRSETRLTENLGALRDLASGEDILLIQRNMVSLDHYRLILVRKNCDEYQKVRLMIGSSRWGAFNPTLPMTQSDFAAATKIETTNETGPFNMFELNSKKIETRGVRIARSVVFRETVKRLYSNSCSVCGTSLTVPDGPSDFEAAHIVPRSVNGADDARNGLGLCRRHHWAFDKGLFGVDKYRKIRVPNRVRTINANSELVAMDGNKITESSAANLKADCDALAWHMKNLVANFE